MCENEIRSEQCLSPFYLVMDRVFLGLPYAKVGFDFTSVDTFIILGCVCPYKCSRNTLRRSTGFSESTKYASATVMIVLASLRVWMWNGVLEQGLSCGLFSSCQELRNTSLGFVEFDF